MKKKKKEIHFLLNEKYFNKIAHFCSLNGITKTTFFKMLIIKYFDNNNAEKILLKDNKFKHELIWEIRRYGNNLNQIAHKLNIALRTEDLTYTDKLDIKSSIDIIEYTKSEIYNINNLLNERL